MNKWLPFKMCIGWWSGWVTPKCKSACQGTAKSKRVVLAGLNFICSNHHHPVFLFNNATLSFNPPTFFSSPHSLQCHIYHRKRQKANWPRVSKRLPALRKVLPNKSTFEVSLSSPAILDPFNSPSRSRMYCLHLGSPHVCCHLEHFEGPATAIRRGANVQGTHHGAQDHQGRPSQCKTLVDARYKSIWILIMELY